MGRTVDDWWTRAECRDSDPATFADYRTNYAEARALCGRCDVRLACLQDVLESPPIFFGDSHPGPERIYDVDFSMFQAGLTPSELTELYYRGRRK